MLPKSRNFLSLNNIPSIMKSFLLPALCILIGSTCISAQENIHFTNPEIYAILKGNYDPAQYLPPFPIDDPYTISEDMLHLINPDSLKATLLALRPFHNRNTGSDTISATTGIGAARKWILSRFEQYGTTRAGDSSQGTSSLTKMFVAC